MRNPGFLKGTGHCNEGRMLIDGRWAPQHGNRLIRRFFLHAELHSKVSGARVGSVLIYVCVKCGHASALRRLDGRPKAKSTGHVLSARMLSTPLGATVHLIKRWLYFEIFSVSNDNKWL